MSLFKVAYSEDLGDLIAKRKEKAVTLIDGIAGVKSEDIAASLFRADLDPPTAVRGFIAYQLGIVRLWLVNPKAFDIGNCSAYHLNLELYRPAHKKQLNAYCRSSSGQCLFGSGDGSGRFWINAVAIIEARQKNRFSKIGFFMSSQSGIIASLRH